MKVHSVVKQYSNGASAIQRVFGSRKRAEKWISDFYAVPCMRDGWKVEIFDDPVYRQAVRIMPPSGRAEQAETIYIVSKEVE